MGGGGENFLEKVSPAPSKPPPPPSKTFPFIESLFTFFLCNMGLPFPSGDRLQGDAGGADNGGISQGYPCGS